MNHSCRWVIVAATGLLGCVAIGAMSSLPVYFKVAEQKAFLAHLDRIPL